MKIYLVGGAVRDELLHRPIIEKDWVVVGATPEIMMAKNFKPVGKDFPVFLHPETHEQYALARTERKVSRGYTGFEFYAAPDVTLEQDLLRRDLTINAIAKDSLGKIIDPFNGQLDLQQRILRHISPAFAEDPVRILRVARFMAQFGALNFTVAPQTLILMRVMVENGEVNALVAERVWQEFFKALQSPAPEKFIATLHQCGALEILMPELKPLVEEPSTHPLDPLIQVCKLSDNPEVRFSTLFHSDNDVNPVSAEQKIETFCQRFKVPNNFKNLALMVAKFHSLVFKIFELTPEAILNLFIQTDALRRPERFQQFLLACEAIFKSQPQNKNLPFSQCGYLLNTLAAVKAVDIKQLINQGLKNDDLVTAINNLRIAAISNAIKK